MTFAWASGLVAAQAADSPTPSSSNAPANPSSTPSPDPNRATFGVQPATAKGLDARPFLSYVVTKGATADDHVAIVNYSLQPLDLDVYATDALNNPDGGFGLLPAASKPVDAGAWVHVVIPGGGTKVQVPPRSAAGAPGTVILPVHIEIPENASPGDHVGGVLASLSTTSANQGDPNVRLDQRVASRVYIRVSGAIHPELKIEKLKAGFNATSILGGKAKVTYRVHNVGNVKLGGKTKVVVSGLFGTKSVANPPDIPLLLPGSSIDVSVTVKDVVPEIYENAKVTVTPLIVRGDSDAGLHDYSASTHFWAIPWLLLIIIVLVLLAGVGYWRWRRSRRAEAAAADSPPEPGASVAEPEKVS